MKGNPTHGLYMEAHKSGVQWCAIHDCPKAVVEYAKQADQEAMVDTSIQKWYDELRAKHSQLAGVFVGD